MDHLETLVGLLATAVEPHKHQAGQTAAQEIIGGLYVCKVLLFVPLPQLSHQLPTRVELTR